MQAAEVVNAGNFTFLSAKTQSNEDSLFVLDAKNHQILIYELTSEGRNGRIELKGHVPVSQVLEQP